MTMTMNHHLASRCRNAVHDAFAMSCGDCGDACSVEVVSIQFLRDVTACGISLICFLGEGCHAGAQAQGSVCLACLIMLAAACMLTSFNVCLSAVDLQAE